MISILFLQPSVSNAPNGEVWIYLDDDNEEAQKMLLIKADGDGSQSEEVYDDGRIRSIHKVSDVGDTLDEYCTF